jgi:hypothetical protein
VLFPAEEVRDTVLEFILLGGAAESLTGLSEFQEKT